MSQNKRAEQYLQECFAGRRLYGDDFSEAEIAAWFEDEKDGYQNLVPNSRQDYCYGYHALNVLCGFRHLPATRFEHVLGFGSAYGDELLPIIDRIGKITIVDPSTKFRINELRGVPVQYISPQSSGELHVPPDSFDLITCFSALHHIPNVSTVVAELFRCLKPGGVCLIREPIVSMGDWRRPRRGLTKRERGLPLELFRRMLGETGFMTQREQQCMFSLISRLKYVLKGPVFNSSFAVRMDLLLCAMPVWSRRYHPLHWIHKLRPTAAFFVLQK
ncbi:MAG: class I SAM-dependent methyltransferase [Terriglobales bacterium]